MENILKKHLLIIDDEENMRHMLSSLLKNCGYNVDVASDGYEGKKMIDKHQYDFILCDLNMPNMNGMEFLEFFGKTIENTTIIVMSAYGTIDIAIEAMKLGAYDYISKPFKKDEVLLALKKAEEREVLKNENSILKKRIEIIEGTTSFGDMVAKSKIMQSVFNLASKAAQYNSSVLITGESGTGKELIAKAIHNKGERASKQLIPVNCGSIPENLLESELFGHKKGAFTGADKDKKGLFEEADGGTIFLDEIGEMPLALQVKLLRTLQENEIRKIGDLKIKKIDVRVIAATSKNLDDEIQKGTFRQDLFYRLNVINIKMPPLRQWAEDITFLSYHFIEKFNKMFNKKIKGISNAALSILMKHKWPGNVRELGNVIERAMIFSEDEFIVPESFPPEIEKDNNFNNNNDLFSGYSIKHAQKIIEQKLIIKALKATDGNRTKASQLLEISHPSLLSKIKAYNISAKNL